MLKSALLQETLSEPKFLKRTRKAREELGLSDKPFVLVFGGSLGAQKINETMIGVLKKATEENKISILFGTGDRNYQEISTKIKEEGITLNEDI